MGLQVLFFILFYAFLHMYIVLLLSYFKLQYLVLNLMYNQVLKLSSIVSQVTFLN